jgi:hypothetical protein
VIWRALLAGEQILDIRKGGLREETRHFRVASNRFWLYPTVEHEQTALLKPAYARWVDDSRPLDSTVRIEGWADVVGVAEVDDAAVLAKLDGAVIWTSAYVKSRFRWKQRDPLQVLALRAYRLVEPIEMPLLDAYVGCTSWVELAGTPSDPTTLASTPALSDVAFDARFKGAERSIPGGFQPAR